MKSLFCLLGLLMFSVGSSAAPGDIVFELPLDFRTRTEVVDGGSPESIEAFDVAASVGYQYGEFLSLGVNYRSTYETGSGGYRFTGGAYGPSISFIYDPFHFSFAYYLGGNLTKSFSGSADTKYASGSGFELSLSYLFTIAPSFAWGPELRYADLKYSTTEVNQVTTSATYEISGLEPAIALYFYY